MFTLNETDKKLLSKTYNNLGDTDFYIELKRFVPMTDLQVIKLIDCLISMNDILCSYQFESTSDISKELLPTFSQDFLDQMERDYFDTKIKLIDLFNIEFNEMGEME